MSIEPIRYSEVEPLEMARRDERNGARLVVEALESLGASTVFGLPGIHALPVWEELRKSTIKPLHFRTELTAGFAADGHARISGAPTPLLLSSGPGALMSLAALMEAASVHVPVVAIASQLPREFVGQGKGALHELPDQIGSFRPIVKHAAHVRTVEEIPLAIAEAWNIAQAAPSGPVFVEIPTDLFTARAGAMGDLPGLLPEMPLPDHELLVAAAARLSEAERPVLWAGGGVARGGAWDPLLAIAEKLGAPVATTFMGKGTISDENPLAVGSACHESGILDLLAGSDAVLAIGTQLGADTTNEYRLEFNDSLIQIDAEPERIGLNFEADPLVGDCGPVLEALAELVEVRDPAEGRARAEVARGAIAKRLEDHEHGPELGIIEQIREVMPTDSIDAWDSTILGYWGASYYEARVPRRFLYPLGSGTIGYGYPASLGAAVALPDVPVLAVSGDGGFQYGIAELAAARQHELNSNLILVDDGGYGILREYQDARFDERTGTDLTEPDFVGVCESYGVPVRRTAIDRIGEDLSWSLEQDGPTALVLESELTCYQFDEV